MYRFSYFVKFLVLVLFSQYVPLLSAGSADLPTELHTGDEGRKGGKAAIVRSKRARPISGASSSSPSRSPVLKRANSLSALDTMDSMSLPPSVTPPSASVEVDALADSTIDVLQRLRTTEDYVNFMRTVESLEKRQALARGLNIGSYINDAKEKIQGLHDKVGDNCHMVLLDYNFNWLSKLHKSSKVDTAKNVMGILDGEKENLCGYFNASSKALTNIGNFKQVLRKAIDNDEETLKKALKEQRDLEDLSTLTGITLRVRRFEVSVANSD